MITETEKTQLTAKLPNSPGVYKMMDEDGKVIYIGKAKNLKKRVKQYFQKGYKHSTRTTKLLEKMCEIDSISVDSELEAMILESNLIKQLKPKYNVIMKDDKNFVYIKITKEDFPRIQIVRKVEKDNSKYIGPKTSSHKVKETFKIIRKIFPFRHCGLDIEMLEKNNKGDHKVKVTHKVIKYPCLAYYIKTCIAPCIGKCSIEEYKKIIENVEAFLEGKADNILKELHQKMGDLAKNKKFEKAAKLRDRIKKVEKILEKQKVESTTGESQDIINYCIQGSQAFFNLFQVRSGKLIEQENFILKANEAEESEKIEILEAFLKQYYKLATNVPKEILIPHEIENNKDILNFIEKKTKLTIPIKGRKNKLLEMSLTNAKIFADKNKAKWEIESEDTKNAAKKLQNILKIKDELKRIECYDISHLGGEGTVGSMIVFENAVPKKEMYRKFKLRTIQKKVDDYKSLNEVLTRRFSKISQKIIYQDYKFKKTRKKDHEFIEKHNRVKMKKTNRNFYVIEKEKTLRGFISTKVYSEKIGELSNLWILKSERGNKLGYKLLQEAIKKTKAKRVYIICKEKLKNYYLLFGFEEIKKTPEELIKREKELKKRHVKTKILAYDKNKNKEDKSFSKTPNLVIIDGGKGQISTAMKVFRQLKITIPLISIAKKKEEIFIPGRKNSLVLEKNNEALKLVQRSRDEAHRFAISFNRKLRQKKLRK